MNPETESILEQLAVERGLVSADQMAEARALQAKGAASGDERSLIDILVEWEYADEAKLRDAARTAELRSGAERTVIGGFELLEKIGQGGMGAVYRARQVTIDRIVALKLMKPKLAKDTRHLERFLREAKASARLTHPNIVQGIDAGNDKGYYYFALEFVDGETLREVIQRDGTLPEERCIELGMQMARALEHAWSFGMVHRDIKPANILIDRKTGTAKLADLGLAKLTQGGDTSVTQVGMAIGTPYYINPEQARGEKDTDVRSDLYSLGATLYHAATGTKPFEGGSAPIVMSKHMSEPPDPPRERNPAVSTSVSTVILKMMAKDREDRYQTPAELLADLERIARNERPLATLLQAKPAAPATVRRAPRPPMAFIASGVVVALLAVTALIYAISQTGQTDGKETDAAILYTRACQVVAAKPTDFPQIIKLLDDCARTAPNGPSAKAAQALMKTTRAFMALERAPAKTPSEWAAKARALTALMKNAPKSPPYADGIRAYLAAASRRHIAAAVNLAVQDPIQVPEASAWLDVIIAWAPDAGVAGEARSKKAQELASILRENADHILDTFAKRAATATKQKQFKRAVAIIQSSVPEYLVTPQLRELIDKKVAIIHQAAEREARELRSEIWRLLDSGDLDQAASYADWAQTHLSLPHLEPQINDLQQTVRAAAAFLPQLAALDKLGSSAERSQRAVGAAALKIRERFGTSAYVTRRLKKYKAAIRWLQERGPIADMLQRTEEQIAAGKHAEADATIAAVLDRADLTKQERAAAYGLWMRLSPEYVVATRLAARLGPALPVENVSLKLKNQASPVRGDIVSASDQALKVVTQTGERTIPWATLAAEALHTLAADKPALIPEDDARGRYQLAALLAASDGKRAKELLLKLIAFTEDQPSEALPERTVLLLSAQDLLGRVLESQVRTALKNLAELVRKAERPKGLERALAAYGLFEKEYGATQYVADNADAVGRVEAALADALLKDRTLPIVSMIKKHDWRGIVPKLEETIDEAEMIAPLSEERRKVLDALVRSGREYLAEEFIYREVFSTRPWRGGRLKALEGHEDPLVARRARRYAKIFAIKVGKQKTAAAQRAYATIERRRVPVRDVNQRLARYNAVFRYWPKAGDQCDWAEEGAVGDLSWTAITDKDGNTLQNTGSFMSTIAAQNFLRRRGNADHKLRAAVEFRRLSAYARVAGDVRLLRLYVAHQAKQAMYDYRTVGDFPPRFCLMTADQFAAAGVLADAHRYYDRLCSPRTKFKGYVWRGYLGRGRMAEQMKKYPAAASDYQSALVRTPNWPDAYACAEAAVELCLYSGKYDRPALARKAVAELIKRSKDRDGRDKARALLKRNEEKGAK